MHGRRHVVKTYGILCSQVIVQVMATFATHLGILCFLMFSDGFFQSQLVVDGIAIKGYEA